MNKLYIPLYALMLLNLFSCEKNIDPIPSKFDSIFVLQEYGEKDLSLYDIGADASYEFNVIKSGKDTQVSTQVSVSVMPEAELLSYSQSVGRNYTILPSTMYQIKEEILDFASDDRSKKAQIVFRTPEIKQLLEANTGTVTTEFVLPIRLDRISSKDSINNDRKLLFIKPSVVKPVIHFRENGGRMVLNPTDREQTYEFRMKLPFVSPWDFEATVSVTTEEFQSQEYSISDAGRVVFKAGKTVSEPIMIKVLNSDNYVGFEGNLSLLVTGVSKKGINYPTDPFTLKVLYGAEGRNKIALTESMLSSNYPQVSPKDGDGVAALLDGNPATHFHSQWSPNYGNVPHYLQVRLNNPISRFVFYYQNRNNVNGKPIDVKISVSSNGTDWEEVTRINSGLPTGAGSKYTSRTYVSPNPFTYFRFTVEKTADRAAPTFFNMAEFSLFGK